MVTVYAIFDKNAKEIYVGMTNNFQRRIQEHKRGQSFFTKKFKNIKVIHTEIHTNYKEARNREKYLKSGSGKEFLKNKINAGVV